MKNSTATITCYALRDKRNGLFVRQGGHPLKMNEAYSPLYLAWDEWRESEMPERPNPRTAMKEDWEAYSAKARELYAEPRNSPKTIPFRHYECVKITLPTIVNGVVVEPYKEEVFDNI